MTTTKASEALQPYASVSLASSGRKTSWPVAVLAVSMPTTRPRWCWNQRAATVAPSTSATMPVPRPIRTPHSATSCQSSVIASEATTPAETMPIAAMTTNRTPKRLIRAAANGAIRPKSARRMAKAEEMSAALQPNSCSSGPIRTPGAPIAPAFASMTRNVEPATTQP